MDRLVEGENTKILNFNSNGARIIILVRIIVYGKVQDWKDNNKKYFFFNMLFETRNVYNYIKMKKYERAPIQHILLKCHRSLQ